MTITIDVPETLVKAAAEHGQSVEAYVQQQLQSPTFASTSAAASLSRVRPAEPSRKL